MITRDTKGDLDLERALLPIQSRSKIHWNNTEYENGKKSFNVKNLSEHLFYCSYFNKVAFGSGQ